MPISLNEIRKRATEFSKEWENVTSERAEAKSFWDGFFNVFGVSRRRVASFEEPVKKPDGQQGYIDLLWKRVVLVEHKSKGKDLQTAYSQAKNYFPGLKDEDLPRYIVTSDFHRFKVYDLEGKTESEFSLKDLIKNINLFGFISGYQQRTFKEQEPVNIKAADLMGELHDALRANGYDGHELEVLLVRLLFCLFAEDTTIFDKQQFTDYIELRTKEDGSDLGIHLAQLFEVLNTSTEKRLKNLDDQLAAFEYVNGSLFSEQLHFASFDSDMRKKLLACCYFDWSQISPAIFGSMFQHVMDDVDAKHRRELGAHYTSEKNILKLIKGLFLDELWQEFENVKSNKSRLEKFHDKISSLKFLDPACGCGNFLIITYRELRLLELEILKIQQKGQTVTDLTHLSKINVDAFYGIEYEEFPAQIAQVAMWLIDHQMNMQMNVAFGNYFKRLPLKKSATIIHGNALRLKWENIIPKAQLSYILGNPPFIGHQWRNEEQMQDMELVWANNKRAGRLDYVSAWFMKAANYAESTPIEIGFVATNSISQGEQPGILWPELFKMGVVINSAHRTFKWANEAKGNAQVHVVIVIFSYKEKNKLIYHYIPGSSEPLQIKAKRINSYLVDADEINLTTRGTPQNGLPEMFKGSQPTDGGHLLINSEERELLINNYPQTKLWIKQFMGADEYLYGSKRYCLWLKGISPTEIKKVPPILIRLDLVRKSRLESPTKSVKDFANYPTLFTQDRQPSSEYLAIPEVSSENRYYIPIGFLSQDIVCSNKLQIIPNASLYMFGVLQSTMHMIWFKTICGRLENRLSYAPFIYNNFPWPENLPKQKINGVEKLAQQVLKVRERYPKSSLADLYDPLTMPPDLVRAHQDLDKFVDTCYRPQPFETEMQRIEYLFDLYKKYTQPLFGAPPKKKKRNIKT